MDPLDREKALGMLGQLALIALAIGLIYLIIRLAVVVPEWGWQVLVAPAVLAPLLYYFLAFRGGLRRQPETARRAAHGLVVLLLVAVASLPVALLAYRAWAGQWPWP
jgi:hypothetical protein